MTKSQEALNELFYCKSNSLICENCHHKELCTVERDKEILQKLVDLDKPMKPMFVEMEEYSYMKYKVYRGLCRKCGGRISSTQAYCSSCGQKIGDDWSKE